MNAAFSRDPPSTAAPTSAAPTPERTLLGQQLLGAGKLTESDVTRILEAQQTGKRRFGETAVYMGLLSEQDLRMALARQYRYPCVAANEAGFSPDLFSVGEPFGARSEALRTLRSQLLLRWFTDRRHSLVITSADRKEGSASLAANLAVSFAQLGERVLLIDANLRNPHQHLLFGLNTTAGLSSLLSERSDVEAAFTPVPSFDSLTLMCAGAVPPNPQELLSKVAFSYLIETAPRLFDIVLVDTPPILEFADALLAASLIGGCVLATHRHRTKVADIEEIKQQLLGSRVEIVGAVVLD
jgi:chain length determinant protein tyrosine kinase EpsG